MLLISKIYAAAQKVPEDFGFRHIKLKYLDDPVDVIVISKIGEQRIAKPLFLYCQDSLPKPVIKYSEKGLYDILPFDEQLFLSDFHIAIVGKPFIPVISNVDKLSTDFLFLKDFENRIPPRGYSDRNYLDYYVFRNNSILKQLFKYRWAKTSKLLVVGEGEGSSIAVKMATLNKKITHLIYSRGNPYGNFANQLQENKLNQNSYQTSKEILLDYSGVVSTSTEIQYNQLETSKSIFSFSLPQRGNFLSLKIPILVYYKTADSNRVFNDLFQIEVIRERKLRIEFDCDLDSRPDFLSENEKNNSDRKSRKWQKWWERCINLK